jgi:hypothetical protein
MSPQSDFWLNLHTLAQSLREEGPNRAIRQISLAESFEAMPSITQAELAHDFRLILAELREFEPILLAGSLQSRNAGNGVNGANCVK